MTIRAEHCVFSVSGEQPTRLSVAGKTRYRKDAIRVGTFFARKHGEIVQVAVTPERLDRWSSNFARMQANGVQVDLTVDHKRGAEAKRGRVTSLFRDGDVLMFDVEPADADSETLLQRCPEVSVEIEGSYLDGSGNVYDDAITAISVCRKPVVPGQQPFTRIDASLDDDRTAQKHTLWFSANQPDNDDADRDAPPRRQPMFSEEQIKQARQKLNLGDDAKPEELAKAVMLSLDSAAKVPGLEKQVAAAKTRTDELTSQLTQAQQKSEPLKLSRDVQGVLEEAVDTKLSLLVEQNRLTPAAADKLKPALKSGAVMLSREANGGETARSMAILDALKENDPATLAKLAGERTGSQTITMSRNVPGGEGNPSADDVKSMQDAAWGHVPSK